MNDVRAGGARRAPIEDTAAALRERVLKAAFTLFCERGFSATSMLEIATHAKVSKRDLYALFRNKHDLLASGIAERSREMRRLLVSSIPMPSSRKALTATLVEVGIAIMQTVCAAEVLMIYRLAIAESDRAPQIARLLDGNGREANRKALAEFLTKAQFRGLIGPGDPVALTARYVSTLWGDLLIQLLLRVRDAPHPKEIRARALAATEAVMAEKS
jgi:AcrR family transcriptional regulator